MATKRTSKKAAAKKTAAARAPATRAKAGKATSKRPAAKKAAAKKTAAKKTAAKRAAAGKAPARTASAKKAPARKAEPKRKAPAKKAAAKTKVAAAQAPAVTPSAKKSGYRPTKRESYMSTRQLEYFREKLLDWRTALLEESQETIDHMREAARDVSDEAERASRETEITFELRTRDRYRKLLRKIDQALERIDEGTYGYCEETGDPIGIERLEARPIATLSIEAQERRERMEQQYGER